MTCAQDPWRKPVDPLGDALHLVRLSGVFYCRSEMSAPWGLELPPFNDSMMFHVVTSGHGWLMVEGAEPCALRPGDFALVPHGEGHRLMSGPGVRAGRLFDLPRELVSDRYEILRHGGGGAATTVICGVVRMDHPAARRLVALLPKVIRIDARDGDDRDWMLSTLNVLAAEARELRAGGDAVITRLGDILVIQAIRAWMARDPAAHTGWLGALRDRQLGRAMAAIQRDPTHAWTLVALADAAGMSRSAFAARFTELVGEPPMRYVARWKMETALMWLREDDAPLSALAQRCGYESEAAFSRAFKRVMGVAPGAVRREQRRGSTLPHDDAAAAAPGPLRSSSVIAG